MLMNTPIMKNLEQQHQAEVRPNATRLFVELLGVGLRVERVPRCQHNGWDKNYRHRDKDHGNTVDAEGNIDAECLDPGPAPDELEPRGASTGVERCAEHDDVDDIDQSHGQGEPLDQRRIALGQAEHDQRSDERHEQQADESEAVHHATACPAIHGAGIRWCHESPRRSYESHRQQHRHDGDRAAEHRQRIATHESGLPSSYSGGRTAESGRHAVHDAIDSPVVEEHQRPSRPLAGAHQDRLVERVGIEVVAYRNRHRRPRRLHDRNRVPREDLPRRGDAERDDDQRDRDE